MFLWIKVKDLGHFTSFFITVLSKNKVQQILHEYVAQKVGCRQIKRQKQTCFSLLLQSVAKEQQSHQHCLALKRTICMSADLSAPMSHTACSYETPGPQSASADKMKLNDSMKCEFITRGPFGKWV